MHRLTASQSCTCQCTQCRKHSSSLFWFSHIVRPSTAFKWTSDATLKLYSASPAAERALCSDCGSLIYWKPKDSGERGDRLCFSVGTVDPLYLFGEGADGKTVPEKGYGFALANGGGTHEWFANAIPGVTDTVPWMGITRGKRFDTD